MPGETGGREGGREGRREGGKEGVVGTRKGGFLNHKVMFTQTVYAPRIHNYAYGLYTHAYARMHAQAHTHTYITSQLLIMTKVCHHSLYHGNCHIYM